MTRDSRPRTSILSPWPIRYTWKRGSRSASKGCSTELQRERERPRGFNLVVFWSESSRHWKTVDYHLVDKSLSKEICRPGTADTPHKIARTCPSRSYLCSSNFCPKDRRLRRISTRTESLDSSATLWVWAQEICQPFGRLSKSTSYMVCHLRTVRSPYTQLLLGLNGQRLFEMYVKGSGVRKEVCLGMAGVS